MQKQMADLVEQAEPEDIGPAVADAHLDQGFVGAQPTSDAMSACPG